MLAMLEGSRAIVFRFVAQNETRTFSPMVGRHGESDEINLAVPGGFRTATY